MLTIGDDYTIYIYEPDNFGFKKFYFNSGEIVANKKDGLVRSITIHSSAPILSWKVEYQ